MKVDEASQVVSFLSAALMNADADTVAACKHRNAVEKIQY